MKNLYRQGIERARIETGAFRLKIFAAPLVQQSSRHLTARAVMHANKKHFLFHRKKLIQRANRPGSPGGIKSIFSGSMVRSIRISARSVRVHTSAFSKADI